MVDKYLSDELCKVIHDCKTYLNAYLDQKWLEWLNKFENMPWGPLNSLDDPWCTSISNIAPIIYLNAFLGRYDAFLFQNVGYFMFNLSKMNPPPSPHPHDPLVLGKYCEEHYDYVNKYGVCGP